MKTPRCGMRICFCKCDLILFAIMAFLVFAGNKVSASDVLGPYKTTFISNYDGDTFSAQLATWHNQVTLAKIRIYGIDTPEMNGGCYKSKQLAKQAKEFTHKALSEAKKIQVLIVAADNFGRYVGKVVVDDKDLSKMLLDAGLAKPYTNLKVKPKWCSKEENEERGA